MATLREKVSRNIGILRRELTGKGKRLSFNTTYEPQYLMESPEVLREKGLFKRSPAVPPKIPVTVEGFTLSTMEQVDGFKELYIKISSIYDEYTSKCLTTRDPRFCIPTHILGPFLRRLESAKTQLEAQGAW